MIVDGCEQYAYIDSSGTARDEAYALAHPGTTSYDTTISYTKDGQTAYIPAGFKVGITESVNSIENGLVIQDQDGNQFVWIPVKYQ